MKNSLYKILFATGIVILSFFINKKNVFAGYKNDIICEYEMITPMTPMVGITKDDYKVSTVVYKGNDASYSISISGPKSTTFDDDDFHKYIKGKGDGSEDKRKKQYRTCPSYVLVDLLGVNYTLNVISHTDFEKYLVNLEVNRDDLWVKQPNPLNINISNGDFYAGDEDVNFIFKSDEENIAGALHSSKHSLIFPLYLKNQTIDGKKENKKADESIMTYFKDFYGFKGDNSDELGNMRSISYKNGVYTFKNIIESILPTGRMPSVKFTYPSISVSVKEDYLNISNYSFTDYDSFKKYALSDTIGSEEQDKGMSYDDWTRRKVAFFAIDNLRFLNEVITGSESLSTSKSTKETTGRYAELFNDYKDSAYNTMMRLINISSNPDYEADKDEETSREESGSAMKDNICNAVCADQTGKLYTGSALMACKNDSQYKKCINCSKKCSIVSAGTQEECMKGCFGAADYQALKDKQDVNDEELQKIKDKLHKVSVPELDIKFDQIYVPNCKDYKVFHDLYNILRIIAPTLVVLFGTLDYAKAVLASDVEKMEKSKKQFPKRLLLLVLFVVVPVIVSILINNFSSTNTTLAQCIINGA